MNGQRNSLNGEYTKSQLDCLEEVEGKFNNPPSKSSIVIAVLTTLTEIAGVVILLQGVELALLVCAATLPPIIVWGMAYLIATKIEVPKDQDSLVEQYQNKK